jgi:hypothetical protein
VKPPPDPDPPPPDNRLPIPRGAALAAAEKELHAALPDLYTKNPPADRDAKLWHAGTGAGTLSPAARYVALRDARNMAAVNNMITAMRVAAEISSRYAIRPVEEKCETVEEMARVAQDEQQSQVAVQQALQFIEHSGRGEDDYDLAQRMVKAAQAAVVKAHKPALVTAVERAGSEVAAVRLDLGKFQEALKVLAKTPDDPAANLTVGRFRCCHQDNWDEGLPHLARGSDDTLKALATKDLADPLEATARRDVGDGWWQAGGKETSMTARRAFWRRAHHWYKLTLPKLATSEGEVKWRLQMLAREVPELLDPWGHMNIQEVSLDGDHLHMEPYRLITTRRCYRGGVDVTVVARTTKNNIRLMAGEGGMVVFNWEGEDGGLRVLAPDLHGHTDGRGLWGGSVVGKDPLRLEANQWHTLRWQLTPTGTKVWANGKLVFDQAQAFDLTVRKPVGVCTYYESAVDVRSVVVRSIRDRESIRE